MRIENTFRFKLTFTNCKTYEDVFERLEEVKDHFFTLRALGVKKVGGEEDDYHRLEIDTEDPQLLKDIEKLDTKPEPEEFIDTQVKKFQSAHRLHNYMKFRAFKEFPPNGKDRNGEAYNLTPEFFHDSFMKNCYTFFGIRCCTCCGKIIKDTQNPEAYSRFLEHEKELKEPTVH